VTTTAPARQSPPPRTTNTTKPAPARTLAPAKPQAICPKIVFAAVEGFGKTSYVANAPSSVIIQCKEQGYDALLSAGRVPQIPAPQAQDWPDMMGWLDHIIENPGDTKVLGLDAIGGMERFCHEFVCKRDFGGDWGERGFASYQKGYDVSVTEWLKMLAKLDQIHAKGISIVILSHVKIKTFKNPLGADYDRYVSDVHDKTWAATARWADAVFFGNFLTIIDAEKKGKGKGVGGTDRYIHTERRDAWDAKNRYGMTAEIQLENDPSRTWAQVWQAITGKDT